MIPGTNDITLSNDACFVVQSAWQCPIAMHPVIKEKLDEILVQGIIIPTTETFNWFSSLTYSWKVNSKLYEYRTQGT